MSTICVAALYKFIPVSDPAILQSNLKQKCTDLDIKGTLLIAKEGINGTIAGSTEAIHSFLKFMKTLPEFTDIEAKLSHAVDAPFHKLKIKLKEEIVTMGVDGVDPTKKVGEYVQAEDWNALISDPKVTLIDTRNDYEVGIGTFEGAVDPQTRSFRDFPAWVEENLKGKEDQKIAMFCTGGIRCEKATSYLKDNGFKQVFHLKGGILKYLEKIPVEDSKWNGHCFVFDQRISVGQNLSLGDHDLCYACGFPVSGEDKKSPHYKLGVSCHRCHMDYSDEQKAGFAERQRQIELAAKNNHQHIGVARRHNQKP